MIRKRRAIAVGVVAIVATIAACLGPSLSTTEQSQIVVPTTANLGSIMIGSSGSAQITIVPASGSGSIDTIEMIAKGSCPGWTLDTPGLPATVSRTCTGSGSTTEPLPATGGFESDADQVLCTDTTYTFTIAYAPTAAGASSCFITLTGASFGSASITGSATGVAAAYAMDVTPKTINFGDVRVGNTGSATLFVRNTGSNALALAGITINPPTSYTVGQIGSAIAPNATASSQITCSPGSAAKFDATLTVNGGSAGTSNVTLQCNGIMSNLDIQPSPVDLTTRVNEPREVTLSIQNMGAAALFNSISIAPAGTPMQIVAGPGAGTMLGSGSSTTVRVRYSPTEKQVFSEVAKLRINHDNNQQRDIVLNAAALETTIAVFPDVVDFGGVCAGTTQQMDVDVKGGTEGSFVLTSASMPAAPFAFTKKASTSLPGNVMPNQGNKLEFTASVTPRAQDTVMMGEVTLVTDIPGMANHKLQMRGEVLPAGVSASPPSIDFGGVLKGENSPAGKMTTIRNCSDSPIEITSATVQGDFQLVLPEDPTKTVTLEPRGRVDYLLIAKPTRAGVAMGSLTLQTNTTPISVTLTVTGLGGEGGGTLGERSYYTCGDCNSGPGASVFALVVVLGLRRRRRR